jgi:hypothetical protein
MVRQRRVNAELGLGPPFVIGRKMLRQESTETGTNSTTERAEDEEALETGEVVGQTPDLVHDWINPFFSYGVVITSACGHGLNEARSKRSGDNTQLLAASSLPVTRVSPGGKCCGRYQFEPH